MTKKPVIETPALEPARDTGLLASIKQAKDFVVDKMAHPHETASEVKEWAERSAHSVDAALESVQDSLASVHSSIGEAREWTSDKATQVDDVLAGAQDIVTKIDDSVEAVQGATNRAAESLHQQPGPSEADGPDADGAWGARTDRPER